MKEKAKNVRFSVERGVWQFAKMVAGRRITKSFASEAEARRFAREFEAEMKRSGIDGLFFAPLQRQDYEEASKIAKKEGFDSVVGFVRALQARVRETGAGTSSVATKTIKDAFEEFMESKVRAGRAAATLKDLRLRVGGFVRAFGGKGFERLRDSDVEAWSASGACDARTKRNNFTAVLGFLRWAKRRGYHSLPLVFERREFLPRELKKQKPVFSLGQVRRIFDVLEGRDAWTRFIPHFALRFFAGLRTAEAERMRWEWIDCKREQIRIPAEITKTGEEHVMRAPFLPNTVFEWLRVYGSGRKRGGVAFPCKKTAVKIRAAFGLKWAHNGARHTFATMHVSLNGNPASTALLLRHRNQQRLWQNYLARLVSEEEAKAYFLLLPKKGKE